MKTKETIITIQLSNLAFSKKPENAKKISKEIEGKVCNMTIPEFAHEVGERGRTFTPGVFDGPRQEEYYYGQEIFVLDFDNGMTIAGFEERAKKYGLEPAVIYETFSSQKGHEKFRVIFLNDIPILDKIVASMMTRMLMYIFPECDRSCKDLARMFYGGKRVVYMNSDPRRINLVDVSIAVYGYTKERCGKNFVREMQRRADNLGVQLSPSHLLMIEKKNDDGKSEDLGSSTSIILRVRNEKSSFFYDIHLQNEEEKRLHRNQSAHDTNPNKKIKTKGVEELIRKCPLLRDFYESDIPHEQKMLLATNLLYIKGGKKIFMGGLNDNTNKWEADWAYMAGNGYKPMSCENGHCPYCEQCKCYSLYEKLKMQVQRIEGEESYTSIEEAYSKMEDAILMALESYDKGIYLINAQTALGKTAAYCGIIARGGWKKPFMVVVPTTKLQEEIGDRLRKLGVDTYLTPNFEKVLSECKLYGLLDKVKSLYNRGYESKAKDTIRKYIEEHKEVLEGEQVKKVQEYLESGSKLDGGKCVVTTHAMFLRLGAEVLEQYEVIIDEDILMTIFKGTSTISFNCLRSAIGSELIPEEIKKGIAGILENAENGSSSIQIPELLQNQINELYDSGEKMDAYGSLPRFLKSKVYSVDAKREQIYFFDALKLPKVKMVVVSATLNDKLYFDYLQVNGDKRRIFIQNIPKAEYKGHLKQFTSGSMSRNCIDKYGFDVVKKRTYKVAKEKKGCKCITFKKYTEDSDIYFGKVEGFNDYCGNDLVIIGTPHGLPVIYEMLGRFLNYKSDDTQAERRVVRNGYEFPIMTFGDSNMRNLHFYFLESDLEQAIGRARLLRFECSVYLFSNYPCNQAEIIQDKYMDGVKTM